MNAQKIIKLLPTIQALDLSQKPLTRKKLDAMAKELHLPQSGDEWSVRYDLPGGFYLAGSLDSKKNVTALWITLYTWEECFEEDYDSEEEFQAAREVFDAVFEKTLGMLKKKLGKPVREGASKDEDFFRYACFEYRKGSLLSLEQNDRNIEEGMEVSLTFSSFSQGKAKPVFVQLT